MIFFKYGLRFVRRMRLHYLSGNLNKRSASIRFEDRLGYLESDVCLIELKITTRLP